ncbi:MAG: endo-1,4-beta-xylanase [Sandaracinaceae bacterium]|nr:endo-1,4-beta-xylanase [Sandaracinaceae bacterium]
MTPENCAKPARFTRAGFRRLSSGRMPWAMVRVLNNLSIHGSPSLVWHAQTNGGFFHDGDKAAVISSRRTTSARWSGRYKGKIQSWDVVNEAINDRGDARTAQTENLRNSSWLRVVGAGFLTLAFQFAREADPDAKLYYNDYGIEAGPKHAVRWCFETLDRGGRAATELESRATGPPAVFPLMPSTRRSPTMPRWG